MEEASITARAPLCPVSPASLTLPIPTLIPLLALLAGLSFVPMTAAAEPESPPDPATDALLDEEASPEEEAAPEPEAPPDPEAAVEEAPPDEAAPPDGAAPGDEAALDEAAPDDEAALDEAPADEHAPIDEAAPPDDAAPPGETEPEPASDPSDETAADPPALDEILAARRCPRLFGDAARRRLHREQRTAALIAVERRRDVVEITHAMQWDRPFYLELAGVELVATEIGEDGRWTALLSIDEQAAADVGCTSGRYRVAADAALGKQARVVAVVDDIVLVEFEGNLAYLLAPEARIPVWQMVWRSGWYFVRPREVSSFKGNARKPVRRPPARRTPARRPPVRRR
jgi:hypothetical protein